MIKALCSLLLCIGLMPCAQADINPMAGCDSFCLSLLSPFVLSMMSADSSRDSFKGLGSDKATSARLDEQDYQVQTVTEEGEQLAVVLSPQERDTGQVRITVAKAGMPTYPAKDWSGKTVHAQETKYGWMLREPATDEAPMLMLLARPELQVAPTARVQ